ncbi:MAG: hypothetical protein JAY90_20055 [Candidatus Thiodiazotropha lotti]|nr:hypothetical protein [Candidatus Thiodiazotropha lotti]
MKIFLFALAAWAFYSSGSDAGILDATEDLEGMVVLYAGDVEELNCPPYGKYDCLSWPSMLLKFSYKEICFTSDIGACSMTCSGFVAAATNQIPYFFTAEMIGGGIQKYSVNYMKCPDLD